MHISCLSKSTKRALVVPDSFQLCSVEASKHLNASSWLSCLAGILFIVVIHLSVLPSKLFCGCTLIFWSCHVSCSAYPHLALTGQNMFRMLVNDVKFLFLKCLSEISNWLSPCRTDACEALIIHPTVAPVLWLLSQLTSYSRNGARTAWMRHVV